jgi:cytidine deaminase
MAKRYHELVRIAQEAKQRAHAPYSQFPVGAALLSTDGRVYAGCNIEISSYSLTLCAERTAIFKAISEGERNFKAIAVVSDDPECTPPCGACRQVLWDLAGNIDIVMANPRGKRKIVKLSRLIPNAFDRRNLERTSKRKR